MNVDCLNGTICYLRFKSTFSCVKIQCDPRNSQREACDPSKCMPNPIGPSPYCPYYVCEEVSTTTTTTTTSTTTSSTFTTSAPIPHGSNLPLFAVVLFAFFGLIIGTVSIGLFIYGVLRRQRVRYSEIGGGQADSAHPGTSELHRRMQRILAEERAETFEMQSGVLTDTSVPDFYGYVNLGSDEEPSANAPLSIANPRFDAIDVDRSDDQEPSEPLEDNCDRNQDEELNFHVKFKQLKKLKGNINEKFKDFKSKLKREN